MPNDCAAPPLEARPEALKPVAKLILELFEIKIFKSSFTKGKKTSNRTLKDIIKEIMATLSNITLTCRSYLRSDKINSEASTKDIRIEDKNTSKTLYITKSLLCDASMLNVASEKRITKIRMEKKRTWIGSSENFSEPPALFHLKKNNIITGSNIMYSEPGITDKRKGKTKL